MKKQEEKEQENDECYTLEEPELEEFEVDSTKTKRRVLLQEIKSNLFFVLQVVVIAFLVTTFVGQRTVVDGQSMENTLHHGDNLMIDKLSYRFATPKRFDIVVFPHMNGSVEEFYIKRVIGVPGDYIRIDHEGIIYINEEPLEESYGKEEIEFPGIAEEGITLRDEDYFVMGDNRNNSMDSRFEEVGIVKEDDMIGKAIVRIYPFSTIGVLD